jgi:hypothetical protein
MFAAGFILTSTLQENAMQLLIRIVAAIVHTIWSVLPVIL